MSNKGDVHDKTPLWRDVLSSATGNNVSLDSKTIIVLGNDGVGKEALINSLRSNDDAPPRTDGGMALEYTYMNFKLEDEDEGDQASRLNVWKLADTSHSSLLRFALQAKDLASTMVVIMADMKEPWAINKSFQTWLEITEKAVLAALDESPDTTIETDLQSKLTQFLQCYTEPAEDTGSPKSTRLTVGEPEEVLLPLGDGVLTKNLGIPIVLVCNKADAINKFESECEYQDSDFDFIQQSLRQVALSYGAALLYTAPRGNEPHNGTQILRDYISHRLFDRRFRVRAEVLEKDAVFVPSGWDSKEKISVLFDSSKDGAYEDVIPPPDEVVKKQRESEELVALGDDEFLAKHQESLAQAATSEKRPARTFSFDTPSQPKTLETTPSMPTSARNTSVPDPSPGASSLTPNSSAMLQNFFESLMRSESNEGLRQNVEEIIGDEKKLQENAQ